MSRTSAPGDDGERAGRLGPLPHQRPGAQAVDDADRGEVAAAEDHARVQVRHQLLHAFRCQVLGRDAPALGLGDPALELLHALRVRATSMPPDSVNTPSALYCSVESLVSSNISREYSIGKMKLDACPVLPPGFGSGPLSTRTTSRQPSSDKW